MEDNQEPKLGTEIPKEGIEYYWCVNCGHNGRFDFKRLVGAKCQECGYDAVTPYEKEEIMEDEHLQFKFKDVLK